MQRAQDSTWIEGGGGFPLNRKGAVYPMTPMLMSPGLIRPRIDVTCIIQTRARKPNPKVSVRDRRVGLALQERYLPLDFLQNGYPPCYE